MPNGFQVSDSFGDCAVHREKSVCVLHRERQMRNLLELIGGSAVPKGLHQRE
jgi:hypothetical protein